MSPQSEVLLLGVDLGGSYLKAGLVNPHTGQIAGDLHLVATPQPATPDRVSDAIIQLDSKLEATGPVGFAFPGVVRNRKVGTASNVDSAWMNIDIAALLEGRLRRTVIPLNDADAAGMAEIRWGAGRGTTGTVLMLTFGTGIGSALFINGELLPNTELGAIELRGMDAELWASARVRDVQCLAWGEWAIRVNEYIQRLHALLWPDLIIVGGGISEHFGQFGSLLSSPVELRPARFVGQAGVIGAALAASKA